MTIIYFPIDLPGAPVWRDCSETAGMLDSQKQSQNFLLAQAYRWPSNGKIGGRIERANWKSVFKLHDFYWMFIIQGDWAEVGGIFPQPLNVLLGHRVLHHWTSSILSWGDALLPLVGCIITGTAFCYSISLVWVSSVTQSCPTLCDPMDCSTPGFCVHHQLPELAQTHVHHISDAIQPSHPLSSPSPPTFYLSQH